MRIHLTVFGLILAAVTLTTSCSSSKTQSPQKEQPIAKARQEVLIETKGLAEFDPENNKINTVSPLEKQVGKEMIAVFELLGKKDDVEKHKKATAMLSTIIDKYPDYSSAYFCRAEELIQNDSKDFQKISSDIDNAIKFHASEKYAGLDDSTSGMYALKAKVDMLSGNYRQTINDLEDAITKDPGDPNAVFNTGGVRPEDDSNHNALQKKDLDILIAKYPNDYRVYLFRGLFFNSFSFYNEDYYTFTLKDWESPKLS